MDEMNEHIDIDFDIGQQMIICLVTMTMFRLRITLQVFDCV